MTMYKYRKDTQEKVQHSPQYVTNPFKPNKASNLLPGHSEFIDKIKEMQDMDEKVKTTLPSRLKSRSFTSSRHYMYLCGEFEAPCNYSAWGEICLVTHMSGRFDLFHRETQSKKELRVRREETRGKRKLPKSFPLLILLSEYRSVLTCMGINNVHEYNDLY